MTAMSASAPDVRRALVGVRAWQLWSERRPVQAYVLVVLVIYAVAAGDALAVTRWHPGDLILFLGELAGVAVANEAGRRIAVPHGTVIRDLNALWYLPVTIVLPPVYAILMPVPAMALLHFRGPPAAAYRRVFTAASIGLAYGAASVCFHRLPGDVAGRLPGEGTHAISWVLLVVACDLIRWTVNHAAILVAIRLSEPGAQLRAIILDREGLFINFLELALGILMTMAVVANPLLIILAVPTVPVLQRGVGYSQLLSQSRVDGKTGLLNAVTWQREALAELSRATRARTPSAVMMVDIDHFKSVNDTYGHQAGDDVLANIAAAMQPLLREYDLVGRFGGEEFAVFLPDTTAAEATQAAERIRRHLAEVVTPAGSGAKATDLRVTVSIGVAADERSRYDLTEMIAAADSALYHVKRTGRNGVRLASEQAMAQQLPQEEPDTVG